MSGHLVTHEQMLKDPLLGTRIGAQILRLLRPILLSRVISFSSDRFGPAFYNALSGAAPKREIYLHKLVAMGTFDADMTAGGGCLIHQPPAAGGAFDDDFNTA